MKFSEWKNKAKWRELKEKVKEKWDSFKEWIIDHMSEISTILTVVMMAFPTILKIGKGINTMKEKRFEDMHYYDASLGKYVEFRRKPSQKQLNEARFAHFETGKPYFQIYSEMGLIK